MSSESAHIPEETPPVLEMRGVAIASPWGDAEALIESIHWRVMAGQYWVVGAGPGAGKTALLQTAAGLQWPQRGELFWFGQPVLGLSEAKLAQQRLRLGLVLENGGPLLAHLTVAENVALPFCYHHNCRAAEAHERVQAVLGLTGLAEMADRLPAAVPRPWRPRVGLARALITSPRALLLDNPLQGQDPRQGQWWLDFLGRLSAGHEFLGGQPLTLVAAVDDLRPWLDHGRQFALVKQRGWQALSDRVAAANTADPAWAALLAGG